MLGDFQICISVSLNALQCLDTISIKVLSSDIWINQIILINQTAFN